MTKFYGSCVAMLEFKLAIPESAVRLTANRAMEPSLYTLNLYKTIALKSSAGIQYMV